MTTNFLDNKICTFKILLSWRFPRKTAFWTIFLSAAKAPPLKKRNFCFYCRLAVSEKRFGKDNLRLHFRWGFYTHNIPIRVPVSPPQMVALEEVCLFLPWCCAKLFFASPLGLPSSPTWHSRSKRSKPALKRRNRHLTEGLGELCLYPEDVFRTN